MTYEAYRALFIVGAILAGLMLILAIILFFVFRIREVIGDLSGKTAKKAIENIRRQSNEQDYKPYKSAIAGHEFDGTGKLKRKTGSLKGKTGSTSARLAAMQAQTPPPVSTPTPAPVSTPVAETSLLNNQVGETSVLNESAAPIVSGASGVFKIEYEITYLHTDEVIE